MNEIEIKCSSLPSLMKDPDLAAVVTDFMAILESIDYSTLERFSNVADEISSKPLSSFLECEVLTVVSDWCNFKFQ